MDRIVVEGDCNATESIGPGTERADSKAVVLNLPNASTLLYSSLYGGDLQP